MQLFIKHISKYDTCPVMQCAKRRLYMHVVPVITKVVTAGYICIILIANMNTKYSSHRQYGYKYPFITNMDINIRLMNARTYDSINAYVHTKNHQQSTSTFFNTCIHHQSCRQLHVRINQHKSPSATINLENTKFQDHFFHKVRKINHMTAFIKLNTPITLIHSYSIISS